MCADFCYLCTGSTWVEDMGRQESPQLIVRIRKGQIDSGAQETSSASKYWDTYVYMYIQFKLGDLPMQ